MKAVELLIRSMLPDDVKESLTGFDDKSLNAMLVDLYKKHPDQYRDISHRIARVGREASYKQGESVGLSDLLPVLDKKPILDAMDREVAALAKEFRNDPEEFKKQRESTWYKYNELLVKNTMDSAKKNMNNFGFSVSSGARGKPVQIQAMLTTPGLYQDSEGKTIPVFIRNSFSEGLRPYEFLAGSYGARSSVISTKTATAKGGDFGKLASQAASRIVVTTPDCETTNGMPYEVDDSTVRNRILTRDTGSLKAGTLLDRQALAQLKKEGKNKVIARSPLTCKADGVCSKCVGKTFENKFTKVGDHIGITAANAMCLAGNTNVMLSDGNWKCIQDIVPGDVVMGLNKDGSYSPTNVVNVWNKGWQECKTYTFTSYDRSNDLTITCTPAHKFLLERYDVKNGKSETPFEGIIGDLVTNKKGRRYRVGLSLPRKPSLLPNSINEPFALVIGSMLGDGTLGHSLDKGSARLASYDPELSEDMAAHLETVGLKLTGGDEDKKGTFTISNLTSETSVPNQLREKCKELKIWGCRAHSKYVPEEVFTKWDLESVCKFIAGLFITDGYVSPKGDRLEFTSISSNLAYGLKRLIQHRLMIPGVFVNKYMRLNKARGTKEAEYCLRVRNANGIRYLAESIAPYMIGRKRNVLLNVIENLPDFSDVRHIAFLKKIEDAGTIRTWDLQVDNDTHMFVTEGLASTHNSEPVTQGALSCLRKGTQVRMADGSVKSIEAIIVGDKVTGSDIYGNTFPTEVTAVHDQGQQMVYKYILKNAQGSTSIECTKDHKILFWTEERFHNEIILKPKKVKIGDYLPNYRAMLSEDVSMYIMDVQEVGVDNCYDISVSNKSELFVLENGMIVSNSKHTAGQGKERAAYGGFEILSQFVQSPSEYLHKSTVADTDGTVTDIKEAQQGGFFVSVDGKEHYVPVGYPVNVKVGDTVEAGDALSEGIVDVRDVVNHKGLGAARKYYVDRLAEIYEDSGMRVSKKNLELFTRGALNSVVLDDEIDGLDALPDDTLDYSQVVRAWKPKNVTDSDLTAAKHQFLAEDTLQHTVGTRLTPKMLEEMRENGVERLKVTTEKPPFTSNMDRLRVASHSNDDWLASMSTSYLKDQLIDGAVRGSDTNYLENRHYAPRLAYGVGDEPGTGFGQKTNKTGMF